MRPFLVAFTIMTDDRFSFAESDRQAVYPFLENNAEIFWYISTGKPKSRKSRLEVQIMEIKSTDMILWRVEDAAGGHGDLCKPVLI